MWGDSLEELTMLVKTMYGKSPRHWPLTVVSVHHLVQLNICANAKEVSSRHHWDIVSTIMRWADGQFENNMALAVTVASTEASEWSIIYNSSRGGGWDRRAFLPGGCPSRRSTWWGWCEPAGGGRGWPPGCTLPPHPGAGWSGWPQPRPQAASEKHAGYIWLTEEYSRV